MLGGVAQWHTAQCAHLLLELRSDAGIDRIMSAIVWPWCDFIDQQLIILQNEKFDAKYALILQCSGYLTSHLLCALRQFRWNSRWDNADIQNTVDMLILCGWKCRHFTISVASHNDRNFAFERHELFQHAYRLVQLSISCLQFVTMMHDLLPFTVIAKLACLQYSRQEIIDIFVAQILLPCDDSKRSHSKTIIGEKLFLRNPVLGNEHTLCIRTDDTILGQLSQRFCRNILEFGGNCFTLRH